MAKFIPRDYQTASIDLQIREPGCGLFLEPGSGKTVSALTAADILMNDRLTVERTLVVAPKMVAQEVWWRECKKWDHLQHLQVFYLDSPQFDYYQRITASAVWGDESRVIVKDNMSEDDEAFLFAAEVVVEKRELRPRDWRQVKENILRRREQIHVVSRDNFYTLVRILGDDWPYDLVLCDESTMVKNYDSKRSTAMFYLRERARINRLTLMSGTPSPRGLENLWSQVRLLDLGQRLGGQITKFRKLFMVPDSRDAKRIFSWRAKPGATDLVTQKISDICLSVRADAWRETDPPRTVPVMVRLPEDALALYERLAEDLHLQLGDGTVTAAQAAVLGNKLIQVASGAVFDDERKYHILHDAKLDALEELVEELDGEPLVVVYWFKPTLDRLKQRFGAKLATTKTKGFLDRFARGELPLLAIQPASAGHGLDGLQHGGHHVAMVDLFHDWELYQQVVSRLDRSGQKFQVTVHQILAAGTKDLQVARVLADKGADQGRVMDALRFKG